MLATGDHRLPTALRLALANGLQGSPTTPEWVARHICEVLAISGIGEAYTRELLGWARRHGADVVHAYADREAWLVGHVDCWGCQRRTNSRRLLCSHCAAPLRSDPARRVEIINETIARLQGHLVALDEEMGMPSPTLGRAPRREAV